jgi:hypothetical protein
MQIRKKWLNQLKNFFNKHFQNIIWHLFANESHQVVKITVPYTCHQKPDPPHEADPLRPSNRMRGIEDDTAFRPSRLYTQTRSY